MMVGNGAFRQTCCRRVPILGGGRFLAIMGVFFNVRILNINYVRTVYEYNSEFVRD